MAKIKVTDLKKVLAEAAKKPPSEAIVSTARQAVEAARPEIEALLQRGFSPREIAELLTENGVKISVASLQTYLRPAPKPAAQPAEEPAGDLMQISPDYSNVTEENYG